MTSDTELIIGIAVAQAENIYCRTITRFQLCLLNKTPTGCAIQIATSRSDEHAKVEGLGLYTVKQQIKDGDSMRRGSHVKCDRRSSQVSSKLPYSSVR